MNHNTIAAGTFPGMNHLSTAAQQTLAASYSSAGDNKTDTCDVTLEMKSEEG